MKDITLAILLASLVRAVLFLYGIWQDSNLQVKFTDVDYYVFSDAARYTWNGLSPFERDTYRYTPLLSFMLIPNEIVGNFFGKLVFMVADVLCGYLIYRNLLQYYSERKSTLLSCIWLLNPMVFTISTRGNAESLLCFFILLTFYLFSNDYIFLSSLAYGFTVHFKIFPIIYSIIFVSCLYQKSSGSVLKRLFSPKLLQFGLLSGMTFIFLTGLMFYLYGDKCLYESLLYHFVRKDHRHNFSPYFYTIYLELHQSSSSVLSYLAFIPQFATVIAVGILYSHDIMFAAFLQTFLFVAFNKVCTSQYFLWYLCLLPFIISKIRLGIFGLAFMIISWFAAQGVWLFFAYKLEFLGQNTFFQIWLAGMAFFTVNILIASVFISKYTPIHLKKE